MGYISSPILPGRLLKTAVCYKGLAITARTFQLRGSGRWTLDLLIGQRELLRGFCGPGTYSTESAAEAGCLVFARHIIDGSAPGCQLAELKESASPGHVLNFPLRGTHLPS
jgi:hypothetical protein